MSVDEVTLAHRVINEGDWRTHSATSITGVRGGSINSDFFAKNCIFKLHNRVYIRVNDTNELTCYMTKLPIQKKNNVDGILHI